MHYCAEERKMKLICQKHSGGYKETLVGYNYNFRNKTGGLLEKARRFKERFIGSEPINISPGIVQKCNGKTIKQGST